MTCTCTHPREAHVIVPAGDGRTEPCDKCGCENYQEEYHA